MHTSTRVCPYGAVLQDGGNRVTAMERGGGGRQTDREVVFPGFMVFRVSAARGEASEGEHHAATPPFPWLMRVL